MSAAKWPRWRDEDGSKGERFWFNAANQLTRAVYQADNVSTPNPSNWTRFRDYNHTTDLLNWTSVNDNGYVAPLQHDDLNQYTNVNGSQLSFDANFNQTTSYYGHTFVYNAQNQLVSGSMQATYDGLGRCVKRTVGGETLLFTYDGWNPIVEWDNSGNWKAWTIYGAKPDEVLLRWDATYGGLIYKHDNQGSVTFILQGNNQIVEKYTYDVYGRPTVTSWDYQTSTWKAPSDRSSFGNRFMFTGREWLADLQVYDYRHRLYNPDTGRFMQSDPLGFGGGDANLFRYCGNDPVNGTDPFGTFNRETGVVYLDAGGDSSDGFDGGNGSGSGSGPGFTPGGESLGGGGPIGGVDAGTGLPLYTPAINSMGAIGTPHGWGTAPGFGINRTYSIGTRGSLSLNLNGSVTDTFPLFSDGGIHDQTLDALTLASLLSLPRDIYALARSLWGLAAARSLPASVASTFSGGQYTESVLSESMIAYRYSGGVSKAAGHFLTDAQTVSQISSPAAASIALRLPPGATASQLNAFVIPAGTRVFTGGVMGGADTATQIFIEDTGVLIPFP